MSEELSWKGLSALLVALQRVYGTRGEESDRADADSRTVTEVRVVAHAALLWLGASVKGKPEKRGQLMEAMCGLMQTCKAADVQILGT